MIIRDQVIEAIDVKEKSKEKIIRRPSKSSRSPSPESSVIILPKIEAGNSDGGIQPVISGKRLGKHNRVYSNRLSVIAERSPKPAKKQKVQQENLSTYQTN
jgi:hypothetical protein